MAKCLICGKETGCDSNICSGGMCEIANCKYLKIGNLNQYCGRINHEGERIKTLLGVP